MELFDNAFEFIELDRIKSTQILSQQQTIRTSQIDPYNFKTLEDFIRFLNGLLISYPETKGRLDEFASNLSTNKSVLGSGKELSTIKNIIADIIDGEIIWTKDTKEDLCPVCYCPYENGNCIECGGVKIRYEHVEFYSQPKSKRVSELSTFIEYVGRVFQRKLVDQDNLSRIDSYLKNYKGGEYSRDTVLQTNLCGYVRGPTTLNIMRNALKQARLTTEYKYAHDYCIEYWNWRPLDLAGSIPTIEYWHDVITSWATPRGYKLRNPYKLLIILRLMGFEVSPNYFRVMSTLTIRESAERISKEFIQFVSYHYQKC